MDKILLISNDEGAAEMFKLILEPRGFEVSAHREEGIEAVESLDPDVVVLDLATPEVDVARICRSIREFSKAPIILLSGLNKPGVVAKALDKGADDYLIKPVPSGVLIAHLKNLIRRSRA